VKVQLLWFPGCPNADAAREVLRRALLAAGAPPEFDEVDVTAPETPESLRNWGSPTILIDGRDVVGDEPSGACCRLYGAVGGERPRGAPSIEEVLQALRPSQRSRDVRDDR
jgi:hypothetical protein